MDDLKRQRLFNQAHDLLDRAEHLLNKIYKDCLKKTENKKAA